MVGGTFPWQHGNFPEVIRSESLGKRMSRNFRISYIGGISLSFFSVSLFLFTRYYLSLDETSNLLEKLSLLVYLLY